MPYFGCFMTYIVYFSRCFGFSKEKAIKIMAIIDLRFIFL